MNLFGDKEIIVGTPSANQDRHRHQPNGDSMMAIEHARREYEAEMRRQRPREIAENIFERLLIIIAVIGFGAVVFWNVADLFHKYGIAVPVSFILIIVVTLALNKKR